MLFVILGAGSLALILWGFLKKEKGDAEWAAILLGFFILLLPLSLFLFSIQVSNGMGIARWEAFYDSNVANYAITVERTKTLLSAKEFEGKLIAGDIERMQQAGFVSERLKEWRDSVNEYNSTLKSMRWVRSYFWLGPVVMPRIPDRLQPLVITKASE